MVTGDFFPIEVLASFNLIIILCILSPNCRRLVVSLPSGPPVIDHHVTMLVMLMTFIQLHSYIQQTILESLYFQCNIKSGVKKYIVKTILYNLIMLECLQCILYTLLHLLWLRALSDRVQKDVTKKCY